MPSLTDDRPAPRGVAPDLWRGPAVLGVSPDEPRPDGADAHGRAVEADPSNDPDDIAAWYPVFLGMLLLGLIGLGGLWVWYFAL